MRKEESRRLWSNHGAKERPVELVSNQADLGAREGVYIAFETREGATRLHLQPAAQPSRFPGYNYLLDIIYDHDFQSRFQLIYSFMAVEITGERLDPIVHALNFGTCERIREYHPKLYPPPTPGETIVKSIRILAVADEKLKSA